MKGNAMKTMAIRDLDATTEQTRSEFAERWRTGDFYAVVEDMHHLCQFIMKNELIDLLTDGYEILQTGLTADEKAEWEQIINDVNGVEIDTTAPTRKQIEAFPVIQQRFGRCCERLMGNVMQPYSDRMIKGVSI